MNQICKLIGLKGLCIFITTILLLSCSNIKKNQDSETIKVGNVSTTISTDTAKLSKIINIGLFKPTKTKFKYIFIDNSGGNDRLTVPGPSDNYLEAVLYFDSLTFKSLIDKYSKTIYPALKLDKQSFNFEWLDIEIRNELLKSDTNYHGHPDLFFELGYSSKLWFLKNKILLIESTNL